jgi:hypothetical protein
MLEQIDLAWKYKNEGNYETALTILDKASNDSQNVKDIVLKDNQELQEVFALRKQEVIDLHKKICFLQNQWNDEVKQLAEKAQQEQLTKQKEVALSGIQKEEQDEQSELVEDARSIAIDDEQLPLNEDKNHSAPEYETQLHPVEKTHAPSITSISMMVLGGFIAVIGITAVALAFTLLNAATFGIAGLAVAGGAVALSGIGLFAVGTYKNRPEVSEQTLDFSNNIEFQ